MAVDLLAGHPQPRLLALGVPLEKVSFNVEYTANTSAASIPLALAAAERDGHLPPGSLLGMVAFGAGFVWAAGLASWKTT